MSKYLKKFETQAAYQAAQANLERPNVSLIEEGRVIEYNPYAPIPPIPAETRVVCIYSAQTTEYETPLFQRTNYVGYVISMEIDGVELPEVVRDYKFDTTGLHTVKLGFIDETTIPAAIFEEADKLKSITIPDVVTSVGEWLFSENYGLLSATIGNGVTTISRNMFYECGSLSSVTIPDSVTTIGEAAFCQCSALPSITIPDSVTSIGDDAFNGCSALPSITIPDSVTTIGDNAFYYCRTLSSITIPDSVTSIGDSAFNGCSALSSITVEAVTPPTLLGSDVFYDTNNCPIYVPAGSVDAYKAAEYWSDYASQIQAIP